MDVETQCVASNYNREFGNETIVGIRKQLQGLQGGCQMLFENIRGIS